MLKELFEAVRKTLNARHGLNVPPLTPSSFFSQHHADTRRRSLRALNRALGKRQARRVRCKGYAAKQAAASTAGRK